MIRISSANRQNRADRGYALLEIVIALAIVALVVAVVMPWINREPGPAALEAKAYEIAALLRDDRNAAMLGRREIASSFDLDKRLAISGSRDRAVRVPDSVSIDLLQADTEEFPGGGRIRFYPDGRTTGGVVTLHRGKIGYRVNVNWLTANVDVEPVVAVNR